MTSTTTRRFASATSSAASPRRITFSSSAIRCRRSSTRRLKRTARSQPPTPTVAMSSTLRPRPCSSRSTLARRSSMCPRKNLDFVGGAVGGGFGGKVDTVTEPLAILGSMLTGRPVRYVIEREEEMIYCAPRGAERIYLTDGVSRDGRIIARQFRCFFDSGAYTRLSNYAVVKCAAHLPGPYTIPNVSADVYCVFTNRVPATAMRGFGVTAVDFAIECQMDKLAHLVGMDPMEFRILNAYRDGDMKAHRREAKNTALIECVQIAAEKAKWPLREEFKRMSSRKDGGVTRAAVPATATDPFAVAHPAAQQRTTYDRAPQPGGQPQPPHPPSTPPVSPAPGPQQPSHGAMRFSSVFGSRRR